MVLPDGTKVWLNNALGLKYPSKFSGSQRYVVFGATINVSSIVIGHLGRLAMRRPSSYSVMAWKRGFFNFSDEDVQMVVRQLASWYDVEVTH